MKKIFQWIGYLLSDSKFASTRRFIGIQAFYNLMILGLIGTAAKTKLANLDLLMQLAGYFFAISVATIVGTTLTDIAGIIKASQLNSKEPIDPFNISKDGDNYR
jgi:hypothetical protein